MSAPHPILAALEAERVRRGLTYRELGALVGDGWSWQAVATWLRGSRLPTLGGVQQVAATLGMEVAVMPAGTDVDGLRARVAALEAENARLCGYVARHAIAVEPAQLAVAA